MSITLESQVKGIRNYNYIYSIGEAGKHVVTELYDDIVTSDLPLRISNDISGDYVVLISKEIETTDTGAIVYIYKTNSARITQWVSHSNPYLSVRTLTGTYVHVYLFTNNNYSNIKPYFMYGWIFDNYAYTCCGFVSQSRIDITGYSFFSNSTYLNSRCIINDDNICYTVSETLLIADYALAAILSSGIISLTPFVTTHTITVSPTTHGTATADKEEAEEGETVTVTVTPDPDYRMIFGTGGTRVTDANDNEIQINLLTPSLFTFVMPDSDVTVTVVFQTGNPYLPGGTSEGDNDVPGEFDNVSDSIPVPVTPDINYADSGMVRLFSPSKANMISFGNYLWSGVFDFENIIKAFANPMDSLISFHKVPFAVSTDPSIVVKFGGLTTTVVMPPVNKQLYDFDFGTIIFPTYYGSAFDYSPYSKAKIYLPYIGEFPLNIDRLIGKTIGVKYKADCYSGTLIAYVTIDGQVYLQQSGSCLLPIPVSMNNYQNLITGGFRLLSGAVGGVPQALSGFGTTSQTVNPDVAAGALKSASDLLQSAFGKPETASSALGGGIAGYLGVQYPYVTITRPKQSLASSFNSMYGYPLNVTGYLQDYEGFVKVSDITLHSTNATIEERNEIYRLLHAGIVIGTGTPPEYAPPESGLKIVFEKYTGRQNSVGKAIVTVLECTGTFRDYQNISTPKVLISGAIDNVITSSNMVCIPSLKRRYFIDQIETNTANSYVVSLRCDVLESFWNDFKGSLSIIERAEKSYNLKLNDNLFVAEQQPLFQMLKFPSGFTTSSYILALSGNNGT